MDRNYSKLFILIPVLFSLMMFSCGSTSVPVETTAPFVSVVPSPPEDLEHFEDIEVHVVHTSDVSGNIFPYDFVNNIEKEYSLLNVSAYVKNLRELYDHVILLDNGNSLEGDPFVDYFTYIDRTQNHIATVVNNYMGYDAVNIGSSDLFNAQNLYPGLSDQARYPYLSANIVDAVTLEPVLSPYTVIKAGGLSVAVLGLSSPSAVSVLPENVIYIDEVEAAERWVEHIRENEQVNAIIALINSEIPTAQADRFDAVFSGTSTGEAESDVSIITALPSAESVSHTLLTFSYNTELQTYRISSVESKSIETSQIDYDEQLMGDLSVQTDAVMDWIFEKKGEIEESLYCRDGLYGPSAFVDMLHLLQLLQTGADISMRAPLSSDAVVQEGEVYVQDVLSLFPYTSHLCVVELTGEQIYRMMEYSYGNWFGKMASLQDDLLAIEFDENSGKYELSQPHAQLFSFSGVNYTVDITKEGGDRITIRDLSDGSPFKMDETYTVVMDSKIILEMNGILRETGLDRSQIEQKIITVTALPFQYYLLDMLSQQNIVEPFSVGNWSIIPDVWFQRGLKNTYPKLFPGSSK